MVEVKVWGDYALFSRPEFKVERVSYPVITPSAARGVLEAIFWKPEFRYEVREIWVLALGRQSTILRNELSDRQGKEPYFVEDKRQQRSSLILKDVAYLIRAEMMMQEHATEPVGKYLSQFERRIERGQCFSTPFLGTREFAADFAVRQDDDEPDTDVNLDIGTMLLDIAFIEDNQRQELEFFRHGPDGARRAEGYAQALFFHGKVEHGKLVVPTEKYRDLYSLEARGAQGARRSG